MDLTEFIRARLDEDEAAANAVVDGQRANCAEWIAVPDGNSFVIGDENSHFRFCIVGRESVMTHVIRHDPARVLREVEAKRAILADYADSLKADFGITGEPFDGGYNTGLERAVKHLAAAWSDHPDYQQDWHA